MFHAGELSPPQGTSAWKCFQLLLRHKSPGSGARVDSPEGKLMAESEQIN